MPAKRLMLLVCWWCQHVKRCCRPSLRRYILSVRLRHHGQAEESRALCWVEEHVPGAELQQKSPGNISFSIAQQVGRHRRPYVRFLYAS